MARLFALPLYLIACLVTASILQGVFVEPAPISSSSLIYDIEWEAWKYYHGRWYISQAEELERYLIWADNKRYIKDHNQNADKHSYTLKMNSMGDKVTN